MAQPVELPALARVVLRSLLWQGCWSFERMQEIGLLYALRPVVASLHPERAAQARVLRQYAGFFNTNPYLSGVVLGVLARSEADGREAARAARDIRAAWMGPLAAIGDTVFWHSLRPLAGWLGAAIALFGHSWWVVVAPLALLVPFNFVHLWTRVTGFQIAYATGPGIVASLAALNLQNRMRRLRAGALCFAAAVSCVAAAALSGITRGGPPRVEPDSAVAAAGIVAAFALGRLTGRAWAAYLGVIGLAAALSAIMLELPR